MVIILLLGCLGSVNAREVVVEIFKKQFIPAEITVMQGDTVIWQNVEKRQYHNVWFKQLVKAEPDYIFPGENYQRTFSELGEFTYECGPHPKMLGMVKVVTRK
jgi:plastocyanin|tara:strand:+ start:29641 stop:29949 length:309 start_codon:yes stop_codon:yes gene_type:complete